MKKPTLSLCISLCVSMLSASALAQTVTDFDYNKKKIIEIKETADMPYDLIKMLFQKNSKFTAECNLDVANISHHDDEFLQKIESLRIIPSTYEIDFNLVEQGSDGFDIVSSSQSEAEDNVHGYTEASLVCSDSASGCAFLSLEFSKEIFQRADDDQSLYPVSLNQTWNFYIASYSRFYAEFSIDLGVMQQDWWGRETGMEYYTRSFNCRMDRLEDQ